MAQYSAGRVLTKRLFVSNIPWNVSSQALGRYFEKFGKVKNATVHFETRTGFSKRVGWVDFVDPNFAVNLDRVNKHILNGVVLHTVIGDRLTGAPPVLNDYNCELEDKEDQ